MSMDKSAKEAALKKLMDLLDAKEADGLRGMKKGSPAMLEVDIGHGEPDGDEDDSPKGFSAAWDKMHGKAAAEGGEVPEIGGGDDDDEGDHFDSSLPIPDTQGKEFDTKDVLSDDEKERISQLYHKHVLGK